MVNQCLQILDREDQALGGNAEGRARLCVHSDFSRQSAASQAAIFPSGCIAGRTIRGPNLFIDV